MSLSAGRVGVRADQVDSHGRVISPSFLNEIMEDLPEWTDLPVRVNGTEQLIPSNPSVPVTSPILADIDYPDERRNNQYFTYRESPTTVDGLAKIKDIKGNTLVWNQLVENGNFASTSGWSATRGTITASSNICRFTVTDVDVTQVQQNRIQRSVSLTASHKYLLTACVKSPKATAGTVGFVGLDYFPTTDLTANQITRLSSIYTSNVTGSYGFIVGLNASSLSLQDVVEISNAMLIDLTLMFGAGKEPTTVDAFTSLFPLPYYAYNSGSLLSFNGTAIKTVGFNQWDEEWEVGGLDANGNNYGQSDRIRSKNYIKVLPTARYYYRIDSTYGIYTWGYDENKNYVGRVPSNGWAISNGTVTIPSNVSFIRFVVQPQYGTTYKNDICINISSSRNGVYEPYEENTTNLPTETYFPTGMKSAGNVYDELTPTKAIIRTVLYTVTGDSISGITKEANLWRIGLKADYHYNVGGLLYPQGVTNKYQVLDSYSAVNVMDMSIGFGRSAGDNFVMRDDSLTSADAVRNAFNNTPLQAVLQIATPVELPTLSFE